MPNAGLDLGPGKGRLDGLGEALEAVHDRDEDVLNTPVAQVVQHLGPESGAFIDLKPKARNVPCAVRQDRQCYEDGVRHWSGTHGDTMGSLLTAPSLRILTLIASMKTTR